MRKGVKGVNIQMCKIVYLYNIERNKKYLENFIKM